MEGSRCKGMERGKVKGGERRGREGKGRQQCCGTCHAVSTECAVSTLTESLKGQEGGLVVQVEGQAGEEGVLDDVFASAHLQHLLEGRKKGE
jgi:hypothetical protein